MWLLNFIEGIRDKVEKWWIEREKEKLAYMELALPFEEKVAGERIKMLGLKTELANSGERLESAGYRKSLARVRKMQAERGLVK